MIRRLFIRQILVAAGLGLALIGTSANAALTINITESSEQAIPIAVVPFGQARGNAPTNVAAVIRHDLATTGMFKTVAVENMPALPDTVAAIDYKAWRKASIANIVVGEIHKLASGDYRLRFHLLASATGRTIASWQIKAGQNSLRQAAHVAASLIYEELLGISSYFRSQLAYVAVSRKGGERTYKLMVSDYDGHDPFAVFTSPYPIMSPVFSPSGEKVAYVAYDLRDGRMSLRVQDLSTGNIREISSRPGINSAPAWSPDGSKLAMTLSYEGNPDIYIFDLNSGNLRQLTSAPSIDTQATWSANGQFIAFTSNRGGAPQIYRISSQGGEVTRLTYEGVSNQAPVYGPRGKLMAFVRQSRGNGYRIAIRNLETGRTRIISNGPFDESPNFAPNGRAVIYNKDSGGYSLVIASLYGNAKTKLSQAGHVQAPSWGPPAQN